MKTFERLNDSFLLRVIRVQRSQSQTRHSEKIKLLSSEISLWSSETNRLNNAATTTSGPSIRLPFHFNLRGSLPPSFVTKSMHSGVVEYYIEVVADRPGIFHWNRRIRQPFLLVSQASPIDINNQVLLAQGRNSGWTSFKVDKRIRRWPWGDYSHVHAEVSEKASPVFCCLNCPTVISPRSSLLPYFHPYTFPPSYRDRDEAVESL
jgi:hypothetical protein